MRKDPKHFLKLVLLLLTGATACLRGQNPLQTLPHNYRLVYENDYVRVIHVVYSPHEKLPVHDHSDKPTVYVYLTDSGPVRFSHVEEHAFSLVRPPEKAGTFRLSPGRLEKHSVENLGDIPSAFLRVELKQVPLGFQAGSFRSSKSLDLSRSGISTEFPGPFVRIERVVAIGSQPTVVKESGAPALLISFSSASIVGDDASDTPQTLNRGDVRWIKPQGSCSIKTLDRTAGANLLEIVFLPNS